MQPLQIYCQNTEWKINIQFVNKSLNSISIHLAFETLWRSGFNTPGEGFSLLLELLAILLQA